MFDVPEPSRSLAYFLTEKPKNYFNNLILDIPVILTPHSGHIDPPTGSWFLRTVKT